MFIPLSKRSCDVIHDNWFAVKLSIVVKTVRYLKYHSDYSLWQPCTFTDPRDDLYTEQVLNEDLKSDTNDEILRRWPWTALQAHLWPIFLYFLMNRKLGNRLNFHLFCELKTLAEVACSVFHRNWINISEFHLTN